MKLKIVNKKKFMKMFLIIIILLISIIIALTNNSVTSTSISYKTIFVVEGETLWDIAYRESKQNKFYEGYDVRDIVQNIKSINDLENANIFIGDKINIPIFK